MMDEGDSRNWSSGNHELFSFCFPSFLQGRFGGGGGGGGVEQC